MDGKTLKRMMRKAGCSVAQMARWLDVTETAVRKLMTADSDYYYFGIGREGWQDRCERAANWRRDSYTS